VTALRTIRALVAIGFLVAAGPLLAHHAWPVDSSREVTLKGTVTSYTWANPHVMIGLDVQASDGSVQKWQVGGPSVARMQGNSWDRSTLKTGDVITGVGHQFSDGSRVLRLQRIVMADGKVMLLYGRR